MSFGFRFRQLRKSRKLNQGEVAKALNISQQMISIYENDGSVPDVELLTKIASYFDVSIDYLSGRISEEKKESNTDDQLIIQKYRNLPPEKKDAATKFIKFLETSEGENE